MIRCRLGRAVFRIVAGLVGVYILFRLFPCGFNWTQVLFIVLLFSYQAIVEFVSLWIPDEDKSTEGPRDSRATLFFVLLGALSVHDYYPCRRKGGGPTV
jgi:uncharacterized membrane protein